MPSRKPISAKSIGDAHAEEALARIGDGDDPWFDTPDRIVASEVVYIVDEIRDTFRRSRYMAGSESTMIDAAITQYLVRVYGSLE